MLRFLRILILTMSIGVIPYFTLLTHATSANRYYPIGTPTLQSIWVDPVTGDDQFNGITGWRYNHQLCFVLASVTTTSIRRSHWSGCTSSAAVGIYSADCHNWATKVSPP